MRHSVNWIERWARWEAVVFSPRRAAEWRESRKFRKPVVSVVKELMIHPPQCTMNRMAIWPISPIKPQNALRRFLVPATGAGTSPTLWMGMVPPIEKHRFKSATHHHTLVQEVKSAQSVVADIRAIATPNQNRLTRTTTVNDSQAMPDLRRISFLIGKAEAAWAI